ncbi:hypothetical protein ACLOJK_000212 [Asimina triloba]
MMCFICKKLSENPVIRCVALGAPRQRFPDIFPDFLYWVLPLLPPPFSPSPSHANGFSFYSPNIIAFKTFIFACLVFQRRGSKKNQHPLSFCFIYIPKKSCSSILLENFITVDYWGWQCRSQIALSKLAFFPLSLYHPTWSLVPFGYKRKDVLLIGLGVTVIGVGLKSGLEYAGVDPLQAGNVVQLVIVLGLTVGWISTYMFRVSNKEMTYVQQLRDYENKVMESLKRLEGLTEAELEALLAQVEEEKQRLPSGEQVN